MTKAKFIREKIEDEGYTRAEALALWSFEVGEVKDKPAQSRAKVK